MRTNKTTIRLLATALFALALVPALATSAMACDERCKPYLQLTGPSISGQPWGVASDIQVGWTVVDLIIPDGCRCQIVGWSLTYDTIIDNPLFGYSAGIDVTQVDGDTWVFHNLDADLYYITFTVYVVCEDGMIIPVSISWYQLN